MRRIRILPLLAAVLLLTAFLGGCKRKPVDHNVIAKFGSTNNGILLYKNLSVGDCLFDDFDPAKYDDEEYKGYLQKDVDAYNAEHSFVKPTSAEESKAAADGETLEAGPSFPYAVPLTIEKCKEENGSLCQMFRYATAQDYINFNREEIFKRGGTTLQAGTLDKADMSVLSTLFVDEDGEAVDVQKLATDKKAGYYRYLTCNFSAVLYGEGEIIGYTQNGSFDKETYSVSVRGGQTVTVIFK